MRSSSHSGGRGPADHSQKKGDKKRHLRRSENRLYIIGLGPGDTAHLSHRADLALDRSQVIFGYGKYIDPIRPLISGKTIHETGMTQEVDRALSAVQTALSGTCCALVSGGDPGIYAMAGLVFEICRAKGIRIYPPGNEKGCGEGVWVETVPGVPALCAGAAVLGAPIAHDFAAVSLSDLLTPWEVIENRLSAAAKADFVIVLYNPKSRRRPGHLQKALSIIGTHRRPGTVVGAVRRACRSGQAAHVTTLEDFDPAGADMQTVIFIGNSRSFAYMGFMVTPRGYLEKYEVLKR